MQATRRPHDPTKVCRTEVSAFSWQLAWSCVVAMLLLGCGTVASAQEAVWNAVRSGAVVLFRHADAPGVGDPQGFKLDDCATQRNLGPAGREQARKLGERLRAQGVRPARVLTSQWCRARDTAELAFPGQAEASPAFNSFFDDRARDTAQTAEARALLLAWRGPGALVVFTHQVNISALSGITAQSGEGVVLQRQGDALLVTGRIAP